MRENHRKSIASIEKLPQFTTMNVIDGQAGIIICSRLIFYSLTIDNILNIIVLLILAGVTIATLTGDNGILTKAQEASIQTRGAQVEEVINLWKSEIEMNENTNSNAIVKGQDELLQELLSDKQVYENEIDRENKTITIGNRVISYKTKSQPTDIYVALYNDGTLVFNSKNEFDTSKLAEGWTIENIKGKKYEWIDIDKEPWYDASKMPQWYGSSTVIKISFLDKVVPENIEYWFDSLTNLTTIENMNNLDTSNVTDMGGMFYGCSSLTSINLTGLDTSNVADVSGMFCGCSSLTSINLTGLDTSNVTDMGGMFYGCSSLTSINLTGLDTSNVTNMFSMFNNCSSLTSLDLSRFDTSNVTNMSSMFDSCSSLTSLDISRFDTSNVTTMDRMFINCSSLTSLDLSRFDTSNVITMQDMFMDCTLLTNVDLTGLNTSKVTRMYRMFMRCNNIQNLDLSNWDTSNVENMSMMFCDCTSLTNLNLSGWNTAKVYGMMQMFDGCTSLTDLDLSSFDTGIVESYSGMLSEVTANVYIGDKWNTNMTESRTSYSKTFIKKASTSQE